jgi:LacI family transcriptional regulator
MPPANVRSLARELRLAPSTVSDALRGKGRVSAATIRRVQEAAAAAGYRVNPLTAHVLAEIRRTRGSTLRGTLATVEIDEPGHDHGPHPRELVMGARTRAAEMGFSIEGFVVGPRGLRLNRLDSILNARGIRGIIVLPSWFQPDLAELDWSRYAGIYTDYVTTRPGLDSVSPDHYGSMLSLLQRLLRRGYRRPGLVMKQGRSERIQHRQCAAFHALIQAQGDLEPVPVLVTPQEPRQDEVTRWLDAHDPDVVLAHHPEVEAWGAEWAGGRPIGFVLLNGLVRKGPCACLDLQPRILGARAAELLVGQILRNQLGTPEWPSRTTIEARFVDGPSLRPSPMADESSPTSAAAAIGNR